MRSQDAQKLGREAEMRTHPCGIISASKAEVRTSKAHATGREITPPPPGGRHVHRRPHTEGNISAGENAGPPWRKRYFQAGLCKNESMKWNSTADWRGPDQVGGGAESGTRGKEHIAKREGQRRTWRENPADKARAPPPPA